jgi:hypothetical protein
MSRWPVKQPPPPPPLPAWVVGHEPCHDREIERRYQEQVNAYLDEHPEHLPEYWERVIGLDLSTFDFADSPVEGHVRAWLASKE